MYSTLARLLRDERPVALATIVAGPQVGAKLLVSTDTTETTTRGTLGDPELDRIVTRDMLAELIVMRCEHAGPRRSAPALSRRRTPGKPATPPSSTT